MTREDVANNISFAGAKTADKPAARGFDQQTQNYTHEAKAAQSAQQPPFTDGYALLQKRRRLLPLL